MAGADEPGGADEPAPDAQPPTPPQWGYGPQPGGPQPPHGQPEFGQPPPYASYSYFPAPTTNGVGTAAGIVGIIAFVLSLVPLVNLISWPSSITAIVLGAIGVTRANRMGGMGKGMAVAGLVLGILAIGVAILYIVAIYSFQATCTVNGAPC